MINDVLYYINVRLLIVSSGNVSNPKVGALLVPIKKFIFENITLFIINIFNHYFNNYFE